LHALHRKKCSDSRTLPIGALAEHRPARSRFIGDMIAAILNTSQKNQALELLPSPIRTTRGTSARAAVHGSLQLLEG
jgi:hypothetical protein